MPCTAPCGTRRERWKRWRGPNPGAVPGATGVDGGGSQMDDDDRKLMMAARQRSEAFLRKQMLAWRFAHPHASYEQYIASTMPENVTFGDNGRTIEWIDERLRVGRVRDMWTTLCSARGPSSAWLKE